MVRYPAAHKAETHDKILEMASHQFRSGGIADVGIASIMTESGLTNGAFYAHFASKSDLVEQVIISTLEKQRLSMAAQVDSHDLYTLVADYLSPSHRDVPGDGCPSAAMLAEIGRGPTELKQAYGDALAPTLALIEALLPGDPATTHARATAIFAVLVGSLQLARATAVEQESDAVLASGISAAMSIAG